MADSNQDGFLRGGRTSGLFGPLVVSGAGGATVGQAAGSSGAAALTGETTVRWSAGTVTASILASNAARKSASIFNDSSAVLYVKFAATASATDYKTQIAPGGYYEFPFPIYQGVVAGIWAAANGAAQVCEGS